MQMALVRAGKLGALVVFVGAAVLEVLGDALIRKGMRGSGVAMVAIGVAVLGLAGSMVIHLGRAT